MRSLIASLATLALVAVASAQTYYDGFNGAMLTNSVYYQTSDYSVWTGAIGSYIANYENFALENVEVAPIGFFVFDGFGNYADLRWSNTDQDWQGMLGNTSVTVQEYLTGGVSTGSAELDSILEFPGSTETMPDYFNSTNIFNTALGLPDTNIDGNWVMPSIYMGPIGPQGYSGEFYTNFTITFSNPEPYMSFYSVADGAAALPGPSGALVFTASGLSGLIRRRKRALGR